MLNYVHNVYICVVRIYIHRQIGPSGHTETRLQMHVSVQACIGAQAYLCAYACISILCTHVPVGVSAYKRIGI